LPRLSEHIGCLPLIAIIAIVIAVLVFIGINAMPGNEVAETIPTMPS
jgi:hypothetical protein